MENEYPQEYYLSIEEIWQEFIAQLNKDAQMANVSVHLPLSKQPQSLFEIIQKIANELQRILNLPTGYEKIQAWLYRTDISEQVLKNKLQQNKDYSFLIAEIIVKRTLQKVVVRYLHKNNQL